MRTRRWLLSVLVVLLLGSVAFYLAVPMLGMIQVPHLAMQVACLGLLILLVILDGVTCRRAGRLAIAGTVGNPEGTSLAKSPKTLGPVAGPWLVGLVVALAMLPFAWPRFSLIWAQAWVNSASMGISGSFVDPLSALMAIFGLRGGGQEGGSGFGALSLPLQAYCVLLYFSVWGSLQMICYAVVRGIRHLFRRRRNEAQGRAVPGRLAGKWTMIVAAVLLVLLASGFLMKSSPGYAKILAQHNEQQREETKSALSGLHGRIEILRATQRPKVDYPIGKAPELYHWMQQDLDERWREMRDAATQSPFFDHRRATLCDLWGHELIYRRPAVRYPTWPFDLYSVGPNGVDE